MKEKLTTIEKRAEHYCNQIKEWGSEDFGMEWRKSKTWGRIAVISNSSGEKCAEASGCGYDKESACLACFLVFLCPSTAGTGGAGFNAVQAACKKDGWKLEKTASGKTFDGYRITKN